ncbi:MAG: SMP-30/gluconolactonase/LRE family protein [Thermomicrobiales bacterium]
MQRRHFIAGSAAAVVAARAGTTAVWAQEASPEASGAILFELPGEMVFPEGVVYDAASNVFFTGSTTDGSVFKGDLASGEVTVLAAPDPARPSLTGMAIDSSGHLIACGGASNVVSVLNSTSGIPVTQFTIPFTESFLNDVDIAPDGSVYVTDSINPVLYRIAPENIEIGGEMEQFVDFTDTVFEYVDGFNANGIVITADGSKAIIVQLPTGRLFTIDLATGDVGEIAIEGEMPTGGDGLALDGSVLYVVRNSSAQIARFMLNADVTAASQIDAFTDASFQFPTTMALVDSSQALVVNSQFDAGENPEPPFTVSLIQIPALPVAAEATPEA